MKRYVRFLGIILIILGAAITYYSCVTLELGTIVQPGSGFFPFWCGVFLVIFNTILVIYNIKKDEQPRNFWEKGQWIKPTSALFVVIIYASVMEWLGYVLSTMFFLLVWQLLVEREKWIKTTIITVSGTCVMYLLFVQLLKVPVPKGFLII